MEIISYNNTNSYFEEINYISFYNNGEISLLDLDYLKEFNIDPYGVTFKLEYVTSIDDIISLIKNKTIITISLSTPDNQRLILSGISNSSQIDINYYFIEENSEEGIRKLCVSLGIYFIKDSFKEKLFNNRERISYLIEPTEKEKALLLKDI